MNNLRKSHLKKSVAGALAGIMCVMSVPALPTAVFTTVNAASAGQTLSVGNGQNQHKEDNVDGYSYEIWLDTTGGSGSMTLGSGGSFNTQWSAQVNAGNFLARRGRNYDASKKATQYGTIVMDYAADYSASAQGNSRLCVYGWFKDPLVEYYIIEDWVNWCPSGNGKTVTIDGAQYDIFQLDHTGPTILGNTQTFKQYFSVRKQKRTSGTITVSDHFKAWADAGWNIGNLTEVALNVEGWESSGKANVSKLTIGSTKGEDTPATTTPVQTVKADANGYYFNEGFENGKGDWTGRGSASVAKNTSNAAEGSASLFVSGREDNWNGAAINLDSSAFVAGNTYSFGCAVMQKSESSTDMKMTLQYNDASGKESYDEIATATASKGKWTVLGNPSYTIPSGASDLVLYVEAPDSLTDFYIDSAMGADKGKEVTLSSAGTVSNDPEPTTPSTSSAASSDTLKGAFAPWFKIGTSVSPYELNSGADFIKKNYSSITPENELKPDSIIDQQACQQRGNNVNTQVNLSRAAQTLKFCEQNGISLRGHTFVWYSQTPDWFFKENFSDNGAWVSKDIMDKRLESFIKNTFDAIKQQYPKLDLYSYDVCNELFVNDGGGMRPSKAQGWDGSRWVQIYGDDSFVINAFTYARKYAPEGCKLYINDYNEYMSAKTNDIYNMAMKLKELGVIDGIGMQSHLDTKYPNRKEYETALKKFLSTGLEVQITELDITCSDFTAQANLYEDIFELAMEHADQIPALTIWGTQDSVSWRKENSPLLFSQGYKPKPAYEKVMALANNSTPPEPTGTDTPEPSPSETPAAEVTKWGDANVDSNVDMSDAVIVMQSIANPSKYTLKPQGSANGDVNLAGNGITNNDALAIQKYLVGIVEYLPESYSDGWNKNASSSAGTGNFGGGGNTVSYIQQTQPTTAKTTTKTTTTTTATQPTAALTADPNEFTAFTYEANKQYKEAPGNYFNQCPQQGRVIKESYNGINGGNNLNVYLPYGYDENKKYNIFYLMHGGGENENTLFYQDDTMMQNLFDNMIMNGELEPLIVVTPTFNKTEAGKFYNEFRQSVVPFVEGKYSTYANKDTSESSLRASRMHRAYGGFSMGSVSTWAVLENCLDIVGYFMPLSGDHWNGNSAYDKAKSIANAVDRSGLKSNQYFIFASTGSEDIAYPNVNPQIEEMKKMSQFTFTSDFSKGNFYFMVAPGKTHWWGYVRHYVYDSLPYFFHESGV